MQTVHEQMKPYRRPASAVVITTAMLSFISYWRAAAIVIGDISSTAYYIGGIVENSIGKAAPWFISFVLLFSYLVRGVYIESCGMFVRAGVYRVVREAMGATMAKLAVSALLFDYLLTGPISAVSAGQYFAGLVNDILHLMGWQLVVPRAIVAILLAAVILLYFWRQNIIGVHESSSKSLKIMIATGFVVVLLHIWSLITLAIHPQPLPPLMPHLHAESLGWLHGVEWLRTFGFFGVIVALSHSVLAMSGEETLAQVYREIAKPKLKNMKRAAMIIFIFSFAFTAICSFYAVMIIPDSVRAGYADNLMSGLVMHLVGPHSLKIFFQAVVVGVGVLILSGACNAAIVGANSVLGRVAEDGVLLQWFRKPHPKYGTTYRILSLFCFLQIITVIMCKGDVILLGEAYAFGVIWSFVTQTISVLILRFKDKSPREWRVPLNLKIGSVEIPLLLSFTALVLLFIGVTNFFTKTIATKAGLVFTALFFVGFLISEWVVKRRGEGVAKHEQVNIRLESTINPQAYGCVHERRVLVAVKDPKRLYHLEKVIKHIDPHTTDIIVLEIDRFSGAVSIEDAELEFEKNIAVHAGNPELLTNVVALAEKYGSHVIPLVVPYSDPTFAVAKVAHDLGVDEIIIGRSEAVSPEVQLERLAFVWGFHAAKSHRKVSVRIIWPLHELKYELS